MRNFYSDPEVRNLKRYFLKAKESFIKLNKILKSRLPVVEHYDLSYHNNLNVAFNNLENVISNVGDYRGKQIPRTLLFRAKGSIEAIHSNLDNISSQRGRIQREIKELKERENNLNRLLNTEKYTRKRIIKFLRKSNKIIHKIKLLQAKLNF